MKDEIKAQCLTCGKIWWERVDSPDNLVCKECGQTDPIKWEWL